MRTIAGKLIYTGSARRTRGASGAGLEARPWAPSTRRSKGQASFAQGIIDLANAGASVITDDIGVFAEPVFQDGIIAQATDQVKARGISYFSAAGNQARTSYESPSRPSGTFFDIGLGPEKAHDFDPGPGVDTCQQITLPGAGQRSVVSFQWDQPFASATVDGPGSQSDLDIVLTDAACNNLSIGSADPNVERDPVEVSASPTNGYGKALREAQHGVPSC